MAYRFFGWEQADVPVRAEGFPGVRTPRDLYDALHCLWSAETCAPRMRGEWTPDNPSLGQCSITAFLAQDLFGGRVFGVPLGDGNYHCYNVVDGHVFDLTSEQFGNRVLCYENNPEQFRDRHFAKEEKRLRYEKLRDALSARLNTAVSPGLYRHFKGGLYEVIGTAKHSETLEPMVVYRALYGERGLWVRSAAMWNETVERGGKAFPRFTRADDGEPEENGRN